MKHLRVYDSETAKNSDSLSSAVSSLPVMIKVRNPLSVTYDGNYIENGLVLHLDGIDKGSTANAWTDLIGGHVFTKNNTSVTTNDDSFSFNGTSGCYLKNTDTLSFNYLTHTIEACYHATNTSGSAILFETNVANNIMFGYYNTTKVIICTNGSSQPSAGHYFANNMYGVHTASVNASNALNNLTYQRTSVVNEFFSSSGSNTIGARTTGIYFIGKIYSIRIYNRLLTIDEMRHNQMIDNKRFNLGL